MPTVQFQEIKNGTNFDKKQLCEGNKNFDKFEELFVYGFQRYIDLKKNIFDKYENMYIHD